MTAKTYTEKNNMSNTLKLRHYIIGIIYHNNHKSVKIPSIRQLATDFKLAKSTVQLIQEQLVQEGYLYSKKGIGTFTNPSMGFVTPHGTPPPLIGIIYSDGKLYFQDHHISRALGAITSAITEDGWNCRNITLNSNTPDEIINEIRWIKPDGLIWAYPTTILKLNILQQLSSEIPFVTIDHDVDKDKYSNRVSMDFSSISRELGKILIKEHRKTMLVSVAGHGLNVRLQKLLQIMTEAGSNVTVMDDIPMDFYKKLDKQLTKSPPPDALIINGRNAETTMSLLAKHNIDPVNQCRVIALQNIIGKNVFQGFQIEESYELIGQKTARIMCKIINNGNNGPMEHCHIPLKIKPWNLPSSISKNNILINSQLKNKPITKEKVHELTS